MSKEWQSPWFPAQFDFQCLKALCCPTIVAAQTAEALKDNAVGQVEDQSCLNPYLCAFPVIELTTFFQRRQIRTKYNLPQKPVVDCLQTCVCPSVGVLQNAEEIDSRTDSANLPININREVPQKPIEPNKMLRI